MPVLVQVHQRDLYKRKHPPKCSYRSQHWTGTSIGLREVGNRRFCKVAILSELQMAPCQTLQLAMRLGTCRFVSACNRRHCNQRGSQPLRSTHGSSDHTPFQEAGTGASRKTSVFFTGWMKRMERAWREMPPSGLERGAPYLRSPLMGQPMWASWQRIWW